jgi:hypothetical protein
MTSAATSKESLSQQIEQLRKEAEEAKKGPIFNYELAFVLLDQAETLERKLTAEE